MSSAWKWFNGYKTWANWVPGWNVWNWIDGFKHNEFRTPLGTLNLSQAGENLNGTTAAKDQFNANLELQKNQQAFNSAEAEKDREFQERLANTQYQRGVADLRAAGLNPWLAVQGSGAATAPGATATSSAASVTQRKSDAEVISSLASTAVSAAIIAKIVAKLVA